MTDPKQRPALVIQPTHRGTRPLLAAAAQSIADLPGTSGSVGDVLRMRVFQPYSEALRQYGVLRLSDVDQGDDLVGNIKERVDRCSPADLFDPPGVRARLFRIARELVEERWSQDETGLAGDFQNLPWRPGGLGVSDRYQAALHALRKGLPPGEAELLELRYARELTVEEITYVLGSTAGDIEVQLELAGAHVRRLVQGRWADPEASLDTLLLEAFALAPPDGEASRVSHVEWEGLCPGTIVGERYEIDAEAGTGGMGNVYRARDTQVPGHVVALKLLHSPSLTEEARAAALRELHLIASVFHPSVVQFKDHGWHDDRLWFVMPWYEGETLQRRMEKMPLTRAEAQPIFEQLALALASIHAAGIRHQDIKPENIFLANIRGVGKRQSILPVLLDLGVAAKEAELLLAGTPVYFAPEVAAQYARVAEPHPVTAGADVFSLCLSLRNALEPATQEDVAGGAVERFVERRAHHSPRWAHSSDLTFLRNHFERWLHVDPSQRPTADQLAGELSVLTLPERRRQRQVRLARWLAPLLLAVVAIFASVVYGLNRRAEGQKLAAAQARVEAAHARVEADLARNKAATIQEDLTETARRAKALANDVARSQQRYRSSVLTRDDLAESLARREGQLKLARQDAAALRQRRSDLEQDLARAAEAHEQTKAVAADLRRDMAATQNQVQEKEREVAGLESAVTDLRGQLRLAEGQVDTFSQRIARLEQRVASLQGANRQLNRDLAARERQLKRLRRRGSQATPRQPDQPPAEGDSGEPAEPSPPDEGVSPETSSLFSPPSSGSEGAVLEGFPRPDRPAEPSDGTDNNATGADPNGV